MSDAPQREHAWVAMTLPSRGLFNLTPDRSPLLPEGRVHVRRMMFAEEELLNSPGMDPLDKIDRILRATIKLPEGVDHGDLLVTDMHACFLMMRVVSFGGIYTFDLQCAACRRKFKKKVDVVKDLNEITPEIVLQRLRARGEEVNELVEPFELTLPDAGVKVGLRFLRAKDQPAIVRNAKRQQSVMGELAEAMGANYQHRFRTVFLIDTINGQRKEVSAREQFVQSLSAADSRRIASYIERRETAIDTTINITCSGCGTDWDTKIPFDMEFLQPSDL